MDISMRISGAPVCGEMGIQGMVNGVLRIGFTECFSELKAHLAGTGVRQNEIR